MLKAINKCQNGPVKSYLVSLPIGTLEITGCKNGLHKLSFKTVNEKSLSDQNEYDLNKNVFLIKTNDSNEKENENIPKSILECVDYLNNYFNYMDRNLIESSYPSICWSSICNKNSFTEKVLKTLHDKIRVGNKASYKELATLSGNQQASRAVGTVMRRNLIPLIIPCHRVIKSDESLGNYSGGTGVDLKRWLLKHESKIFSQV